MKSSTMIISKEKLAKIKEIIENHYNRLAINTLGTSVFSKEELRKLKDLGIDTTKKESFLELVYHHNFINEQGKINAPVSFEEMQSQQKIPSIKPIGEAHTYAIEHLNENAKHLVDKLKNDVKSKIENIIRENNNLYKFNALMNLDRPAESDQLVKDSTIGKLKQQLRDFSKEPNRDWGRIVRTEMSNAIGAGSVDRIVSDNKTQNLDDIYVFRIIVPDTTTCKYCRKFYLDEDNTPKVYRLSTLLSNGSNYGKKPENWNPVSVATHPNERCSQIIELRPGWKVSQGGKVTFIGFEKWKSYILNKVSE